VVADLLVVGLDLAYVDHDPMVLSHARALLANPGVAVVAADLRDPTAVLADHELSAVVDLAEPVCVILGAVLHFLDADTARAVTGGYARRIAPGSCLVISCAAYDDEALAKRLAADYTAGPFVNHTRQDVVSFFAGLELVGPGVSEARTWRAWHPEPVLQMSGGVLARMRPGLGIGAALGLPGGNVGVAAARELGTHAPPGRQCRDGS